MKLPSKDAVLSLMQLAESSPEAARYLQEKFIALLVASKLLPTLPDLVQAVADYVKNVELQATLSAKPWNGEPVPSAHANRELQSSAAEDAVQVKTGEPLRPLSVDVVIAVDEKSQMEREYSSGGVPLDGVTQEHMDRFFKAWIAEHEMDRQGHVMYKAGEGGLKVSPDELSVILKDDEKGLANYVGQNSRGRYEVTSLKIEQLTSPQEHPAPAA